MEADSTTFESSPKNPNCESAFPFPVSSGNYQLYNTFATRTGERSLEWQIVEKLQAHRLLPSAVKCPTGKAECRVVCKNARVIDRVQWVCEVCGVRQPVRLGSFFMKLQCSLLQALQIILAWSEDADCAQAAQHFGVKDRVANAIYNNMDDLAIKEQKKCQLGGENSVVLAEMYPDCVNRLSPDTTDQPHVHRILMLADTNHIPTRYWLHVIKDDKKTPPNSILDNERLKAKVEEVVKTATLPNSMIVTGNSVPAIEGAAHTQQLLQHCDTDMQHFLTSRIWRGALTLCGASRELCAGGAGVAGGGAACAGVVQRYLDAALFRARHDDLLAHALRLIATDRGDLCN